jgi:hypothetical protein
MTAVFQRAENILRGRSILTPGVSTMRQVLRLAGFVVLFGTFYGGVMGTFSATSPERALQIVYSAVKVPLLLLVTFTVALPSFFVMNTLMGTRSDFRQAIEALITTQAGLTIVLASLAPFTGLWYCSSGDYNWAILFNGLMFAIASFTAQLILRRLYAPLIRRNPRHRTLLKIWLGIYIFVAIQMAWVLRPFVGSPLSETRFFREGAFSNAYVFVFQLVWNQIAR